MAQFKLTWDRQGEINWEQWWVDRRGQERSRVPGLDDHIGFANYDLAQRGLPSIAGSAAGLSVEVDLSQLPLLKQLVGYHGFSVDTS